MVLVINYHQFRIKQHKNRGYHFINDQKYHRSDNQYNHQSHYCDLCQWKGSLWLIWFSRDGGHLSDCDAWNDDGLLYLQPFLSRKEINFKDKMPQKYNYKVLNSGCWKNWYNIINQTSSRVLWGTRITSGRCICLHEHSYLPCNVLLPPPTNNSPHSNYQHDNLLLYHEIHALSQM